MANLPLVISEYGPHPKTYSSDAEISSFLFNSVEDDRYVFGWGQYSEITNGRFAMIGFAAIILIEIISKKSFLDWAGIIH